MSKRRISHQQTTRIENKQKKYRKTNSVNRFDNVNDGLVITRYNHQALIESQTGALILCSIRPGIDSLVAGDQCVWQPEGVQQGVVVSRYPRQSVLGRPTLRGQIKPVAANITQMLIVIAPEPQVSWILLDSYLVIAEHLHLQAKIILNKVDLACDTIKQELVTHYEPLGYPTLFTSHRLYETYSNLQESLDQQISVFVGQSGVGKSSLIARILPSQTAIETSALSAHRKLGTHTTSSSNYYHLTNGGAIIDSPGVREFGLWHMSATEIAKGYREFRSFLPHCKYRNCNHKDTPNCALTAALEKKLISKHRYQNFVKLSLKFEK